jgi:voltage-gated potassium channel
VNSIDPAPAAEPVTRARKVEVVGRAVGRAVVMAAGVLVAYSMIAFDRAPTVQDWVIVVCAVAFVALISVFELRAITVAEYPTLRAIESLVVSLVVLLVTFAGIYIVLSNNDAGAFSEPMDHVAALYFALTTLATVGYGDIAPVSDVARIFVMVQMVVDLVVIGVFIKLVTQAVRSRLELSADEF